MVSFIGSAMNFRLVWVGPDDDSDKTQLAQENRAALSAPVGRATSYEVREGEMVRRQKLGNGRWKFTSLANFTARIVGDLVPDDGGRRPARPVMQ